MSRLIGRSVDQLSADELSRWICERLGWKFGNRDQCAPEYPDDLDQCWWCQGIPCSESELPNAVTNPAMTVMLLEKMPAGGVMFVPEYKWWRAFSDYSLYYEETTYTNEVEAASIGRAVAEAWALANGYQEETEGHKKGTVR